MSQPSLKEKTAKGLLWGGIGNGALQLLNLAFGIFLSRLLTPADYGMVGALFGLRWQEKSKASFAAPTMKELENWIFEE